LNRGRLAPSPTGDCHLGNAAASLVAWWSARCAGGSLVLRIEDLDRARCREAFVERWIEDLRRLRLDWDEGPDRGGPCAPYVQSRRFDRYREAFESLKARELAYPCFCSRKDVRVAAGAPQEPGDELRYAGTCRDLAPAEVGRRRTAGEPHCWRFPAEGRPLSSYDDAIAGPWPGPGFKGFGDFVIWRRDDAPAYQLAVTVDDRDMRIEQVVRGNDLRDSAGRQRLLFEALGAEPPTYAHVPLLCDDDGIRLSKRQRGITIRELTETGRTPEAIVGGLAHVLGLTERAAPATPQELLTVYEPTRLGAVGDAIRLDLDRWRDPSIALDR